MSDVLHTTWLPALQRLFLWGEAGAAASRKGRKGQPPAHPFQPAPTRLCEVCRPHVSTAPASAGIPPAKHTLTLWLPSSPTAPFASPELLATGALAAPAV